MREGSGTGGTQSNCKLSAPGSSSTRWDLYATIHEQTSGEYASWRQHAVRAAALLTCGVRRRLPQEVPSGSAATGQQPGRLVVVAAVLGAAAGAGVLDAAAGAGVLGVAAEAAVWDAAAVAAVSGWAVASAWAACMGAAGRYCWMTVERLGKLDR